MISNVISNDIHRCYNSNNGQQLLSTCYSSSSPQQALLVTGALPGLTFVLVRYSCPHPPSEEGGLR